MISNYSNYWIISLLIKEKEIIDKVLYLEEKILKKSEFR